MTGLCASTSHALIPTIDASAIAEGIKSNIELVKQSKIVVDATKLTGEISSTLGEVKASLSELAVDELKKAAEFVQKQKENFEEAKQQYEDYKKQVEEAKQELEEGKQMLADAKKKAEGAISDATQAYNEAKSKVDGVVSDVSDAYKDAKEKYDEAKSKVDGVVSDVSDAYKDVKEKYDDAKEKYEDYKEKYEDGKEKISGVLDKINNKDSGSDDTGGNITIETRTTGSNYSELEEAQAEIERLREELNRLQSQSNNTPDIVLEEAPLEPVVRESFKVSDESEVESSQEAAETPEDLDEALEEIERLKKELEKYQNVELDPETSVNTSVPINGELLNEQPITPEGIITEIDEKTKDQETEASQNTQQSLTPVAAPLEIKLPKAKSFRQRPQIETQTLYDINASAEYKEEKYAYQAEVREKMMFGQVSSGITENVPTGKNDTTGEFIISQEMAQYCGVNINNATKDELTECMKKIITYRSNPNMKTAEKGDELIDKILYENATALAAEAMVAKNKAKHFKEDVLIPMKADAAAGQATVKDDISYLSEMQGQVQNLMIELNSLYASQLYYDSSKKALSYQLKEIDPDAAAELEKSNANATGE